MWGPIPGAADPIFPGKNWRLLLVITVRVSAELATFFGHHSPFYSLHSLTGMSPIISGTQNICRSSCGGPFLWGPSWAEYVEHV